MVIITVIITIKRNLPYAKQVQKHLQKHEFPNPMIRVCPAAPPKSSNDEMLKSASFNHYNSFRWFVEKHPSTNQRRNHLIVCEDDCEMIIKNSAFIKIKDSIEYLDHNHSNWTTFHIGHCPIGPMFPTEHEHIVRTVYPYTAHCYAINGYHMQQLLQKHPNENLWIRPNAIEGWKIVSTSRKFALYPMIATQNRLPREVKDYKLMQTYGLPFWIHIVENIMMYGVQGICLIFLVIVLVRLLKK